MSNSVAEKWQRLGEDLSDYLQLMKEDGQTHIEAPADVLKISAASRTSGGVREGGHAVAGHGGPGPTRPTSASTEPVADNNGISRPAGQSQAARAVPDGDALGQIAAQVAQCRLCGLCETRKHTVPGQGARHPALMFVGEGPGADEDEQGLAFVGRAGQLLTKMIEAMGYSRDEVWIGNIVKCRPPNNRVPTAEEMAACMPYLKQQIALLKPKVIVCLGATAVKGLLNPPDTISKVRGTWMKFEGIDTMPTFHPAYLLRNPPAKKFVWEDLKAVMQRLQTANR